MNVEVLFRRLLYLQVVLGLAAFALAENNPGFFLVAGALALLSWYFVEGPQGRPLGRWLINLGASAALLAMLVEVRWLDAHVLTATGHLMTWLLVLLLYSRKRNHDYVLIFVLSLMQMLCASLLSVSMFYGILLLVYSLAAVWSGGAVALKVAADRVHQASQQAVARAETAPRPSGAGGPNVARQFHLLLAVVAAGVFVVAMFVFVFCPRYEHFGAGGNWTRLLPRPSIGFTNEIRLGGPPPSPDNQQAVMTVAFSENGVSLGASGRFWRLRGASLDEYDPADRRWSRGSGVASQDRVLFAGDERWLVRGGLKGSAVQADITLPQPPEGRLFTLFPPASISGPSLLRLRFNRFDQEMATLGERRRPIAYRLTAPLTAASESEMNYGAGPRGESLSTGLKAWDPATYARGWLVQTQRVRQLAQQILAAAEIEPNTPSPKAEEKIAAALTQHLRTRYAYSLSSPGAPPSEDPVLNFLFVQRQGHCELFASALAALARSLGLPARVVTGYLANEFNAVGGFYVVRESDAHAWCEIQCDGLWRTFDPSPPADVSQEHQASDNWLLRARHLYEYLDFAWIRSIVAYDQQRRTAFMSDVAARWLSIEQSLRDLLHAAASWLRHHAGFWLLLVPPAALLGLALLLALARRLRRRLLDRRWLRHLQLSAMPRPAARRLARQLTFYLAMLTLLHRHGHRRPPWQPPGDFARGLARDAPDTLGPVLPLTELFYAIRFGGQVMDAACRSRAQHLLRRLTANLARSSAPR